MQTKLDLAGIPAEQMKNVVIAYEPVWAIGTGLTATPEQAEEVCALIRKTVAGLYSDEVAEALTIQYGGSMNDGNAAELLSSSMLTAVLFGRCVTSFPKSSRRSLTPLRHNDII